MKYLVLPLFSLFALPAISAETLTIDPDHSAVVFSWDHHGYTNPVARFEKIEGNLVLDEDLTKSSVSVKLAVDGIHTAVPALDRQLVTAEFLDAAMFPDITFKSTKIEKGPMDSLKISGNLSVHGVTRLVVLDGKVNKIKQDPAGKATEAGFDAMVKLNRADFGVNKYFPNTARELTVHITVAANSAGS
ncbi:polyisoprenoid-binding protein [Rugamonas sp. FT107W]|uniref:Polyisoprenoid-binding protein n=1 Tax=Duganella vulcania TaxID=2692166 RepID=A0A845HHZ4_9BURK|nr:YceI family protein [Duganella vulcania]MYN17023.1 polyisoprenoid-binding protein [Duganella vulcania]